MEQMSQGLLHVSKGKNIIVVETKITNKSTQVQADKELYEFVDNLLDHGYEILNNSRTYFDSSVCYFEDRWVLKSPN